MRTEYGFDTRFRLLRKAMREYPETYFSLYVEETGKENPTFLEVEDYMFQRAQSLADRLQGKDMLYQSVSDKVAPVFSNLAGFTYTEKPYAIFEDVNPKVGTVQTLRLTTLGKQLTKKKSTKIRDEVHKIMGLK